MKVTDEMVSRFLGWNLPQDFAPDCGISFDGRKDDEWNKNKTWPVGTNLLTAVQARAMLERVLGNEQNGEQLQADRFMALPENLRRCLWMLAHERIRQDEKWGGHEHDDLHTTADFAQLAQDYAGWARVMAGMGSIDKAQRRMLQVAALALADVERAMRCIDAAHEADARNEELAALTA